MALDTDRHRPRIILEGALLAIFAISYIFMLAYSRNSVLIPTIALTACLDLIIGMGILFAIILVTELYGRLTKNHDAVYELVSLIRLIGYPTIAIAFLGVLGINVTSLLVGAGFLGIVIGLAAQTTLGNIFSGFALLYTKPFKVGDKIAVSTPQYSAQGPSHPHGTLEIEVVGFVKSIGMMHTRILRDDMTMIYIPNSVINVGLITNYSNAPERLIVLRAEIGRRVDTRALKIRLEKAFLEKEFSGIRDLDINTAAITTDTDVGIIVTARVSQLDYRKLRNEMADKLNDVIRKRK